MVWVISGAYTDRATITRLGAESEDGVVFMPSSYRLHAVFVCFAPNTGERGCMHGRQDRTTPNHEVFTLFRNG